MDKVFTTSETIGEGRISSLAGWEASDSVRLLSWCHSWESKFETKLDKSGGNISLYHKSPNLRQIWTKVGENICLYYESPNLTQDWTKVGQSLHSCYIVTIRLRPAEKKNPKKEDFFCLINMVWYVTISSFRDHLHNLNLNKYTSKSTPKYLFDSPTQSVTFLLRLLF